MLFDFSLHEFPLCSKITVLDREVLRLNYNIHRTYFMGFDCFCCNILFIQEKDISEENIKKAIVTEYYSEEDIRKIEKAYKENNTSDTAIEALQELNGLLSFAIEESRKLMSFYHTIKDS